MENARQLLNIPVRHTNGCTQNRQIPICLYIPSDATFSWRTAIMPLSGCSTNSIHSLCVPYLAECSPCQSIPATILLEYLLLLFHSRTSFMKSSSIMLSLIFSRVETNSIVYLLRYRIFNSQITALLRIFVMLSFFHTVSILKPLVYVPYN